MTTTPVAPVDRSAGRTHGPADVDAFAERLRDRGLLAGLRFLHLRTPHRFTGIFRFDEPMLRNVALIDKWFPAVVSGDDVPLAQAYCAHLHATGESLEVVYGPGDPRVPWTAGTSILSYCGAVICDDQGRRWGALCHFDTAACESKHSELPLLNAAATLIYHAASAHAR